MNPSIAFLGAGAMAEALVKGLLRSGVCLPDRIFVFDPSETRRHLMRAQGIQVANSNQEAAQWGDIVVLCVKPPVVGSVLREIRNDVRDKTVLSVAAGIPIARLSAALPEGTKIVRAMPNAPALAAAGATALSEGRHVHPDDMIGVKALFEAVGRVWVVPESLLDAVTGLSGSGPAFVFLAIEAMVEGGVKCGLPRELSSALTLQTFMGAAAMLAQGEGGHPAVLKDRVTSPGGTTTWGLYQLETAGVRAAFISAVEAAAKRAQEIGKDWACT